MIRDWQEDAACRRDDIDPEIFFRDSNASVYQAKVTCASCPVRAACERAGRWEETHRADNLAPEDVGVWGGLTGRELAHAERQPVRSTRKLARDQAMTLLIQGAPMLKVSRTLGVPVSAVRDWMRDAMRARAA